MDTAVHKALVVALLAVNSYPIERVRGIQAALEKVGLFDLTKLGSFTEAEIAERLRKAGYDRGAFLTDLIASRLQNVGQYLGTLDVESAMRVLTCGSAEDVRAVLSKAKGIGPTVIRNFLLIRGLG